jgi:hypothetical protein
LCRVNRRVGGTCNGSGGGSGSGGGGGGEGEGDRKIREFWIIDGGHVVECVCKRIVMGVAWCMHIVKVVTWLEASETETFAAAYVVVRVLGCEPRVVLAHNGEVARVLVRVVVRRRRVVVDQKTEFVAPQVGVVAHRTQRLLVRERHCSEPDVARHLVLAALFERERSAPCFTQSRRVRRQVRQHRMTHIRIRFHPLVRQRLHPPASPPYITHNRGRPHTTLTLVPRLMMFPQDRDALQRYRQRARKRFLHFTLMCRTSAIRLTTFTPATTTTTVIVATVCIVVAVSFATTTCAPVQQSRA